MKVNDFDFALPEDLIAQTPIKERTHSRLLVLDKDTGEMTHKHFYDIIDYLSENDVLVVNDTKVIPARLFGVKKDTQAHIEVLLLKQEDDVWEALVKPARRVKVGTTLVFGDGRLKATCTKEDDEGIRHLKMDYEGIFLEVLETLGEMPLPPYIHEKLDDKDRYQTVYAKASGSVAAPTAGLHFTEALMKKITDKGIQIIPLTLHVGLGTFRPVSVDDVLRHKMHSEFYQLSAESASALNEAVRQNKRIISVGTTSTRTLESIVLPNKRFEPKMGWTDIFIYPGYTFKAVDGLITNFHLPKSTLVMLVSAFSSKDIILNAYQEAINQHYRFFSFGDSMFIASHKK